VRYVSRMDVMRSILRTLNGRKEPEGGIMHGENITQAETKEYLELLLQNDLVAFEEGGLYVITPGGTALLEKWDRIDSAIVENARKDASSQKRRSEGPLEATRGS
jgi:predicted transcriptional regulator